MIQFNSLPVEPNRVTSPFGKRIHPLTKVEADHNGIDIGRNFNLTQTPILAVKQGVVSQNYWNSVRGWVIVLKHDGFLTLYQHLKAQSPLKAGATVKSGQQVGIMGMTGSSAGIHLHFELRVNGLPIDPLPYLNNIKKEEKDLTEAETRALFTKMQAEQNAKPVNTWAKSAWDKAKAKGVFDGTAPQGTITREQVAVVLDRMKLL